ncbi:MAG: Na/Pi cotransporter family protein [Candidatus Omnitrophota bacterium]
MAQEIIFGVLGGLGLFIYGIRKMSDGLHKASGEKLRKILHSLTKGPKRGVLVGAGITSLIQSSSATTVMVVGFVNAGLMTLTQSLGVIFGANIGTTITAQLIAFKLTDYALPVIGVAMFVAVVSKRRIHKNIAECFLGFGILFLGLNILTQVIKPLGDLQSFKDILLNFAGNPLLGVLAGTLVTAIMQSSSVTTGMILGLSMAGLINLELALPLVLGCNIGTCVTALIASFGTSVGAKRAAAAHIIFNIVGVAIFLPFLVPFKHLVFFTSSDTTRQIANAHTLFNVINTLIFIPLIPLFAKFLNFIIKGKEEEEVEYLPKFLERHLLNTPPIAIEAAIKEIVRTLSLTKKMIIIASNSFINNDLRSLEKITRREEAVDSLREAITDYLVQLMQNPLSPNESKKIPPLIHAINDVERIGDHAENLRDLAEQKIENRLSFSVLAVEELQRMFGQIDKMIDCSIKALQFGDLNEAKFVMDEECQINLVRDRLKNNHTKRLEEGKCNVLSGVVFLDIISNLEKIGDHLNNVAQAVMVGLQ